MILAGGVNVFGGYMVERILGGLGFLVVGGGRVVVVVGVRIMVVVVLGVVVGGKGGERGGGGNNRFISNVCVPSASKLDALL